MREGLHQVDIKLDAIMELLATRKQLHNLVRELRAQGLKLDATAIFAELGVLVPLDRAALWCPNKCVRIGAPPRAFGVFFEHALARGG